MKVIAFMLLALVATTGTSFAQQGTDENQEDEHGAFVTMLGADTLAVERFRYTPGGMEASVVLRTPRTTVSTYRLDLDEAGRLTRYEATVRTPSGTEDEAPMRHVVAVPVGDSVSVTVTADGSEQVRTVAGGASALPFVDMVHWPFELMLRRAWAGDAGEVSQPLFTERGALAFVVGKPEAGRMTVTHPFRGTMAVTVDAEGRLLELDAGATTRKLIVTRVDDVDLEALAQRWAAQDAAGRSFGALSGRGEATAQVQGATIAVDYGQPAKRGRDIFGALVPWGELWRTGANQATHFVTDHPLRLGDLEVPAGRYTLYTIPEEDGGLLIVNTQTGQGGTTYDAALDLGRVPMQRRTLDAPVELFTIDVEETEAGGELRLMWDTTVFAVPFTVE